MFSSLRTRLGIFFLLPTLLFFSIATSAAFRLAQNILEEELGKSLTLIAASAATQIRGSLLQEIAPGDENNEGTLTYRNIWRRLSEVQKATASLRVFVFSTEGKMWVDTARSLPVGADIPELARDRQELARVFQGQATPSQVLFEGPDGRMYKTGYAPIRIDDEVVGAIAVEASAEFLGPLKTLFWAFAAFGAVASLLLLLLSFAVSYSVSSPLKRLGQSALRIGKGDLTTPVPSENLKEIGLLSKTMEDMRDALLRRDEQLKMMLAGVAHEVRNPMGGIELFAGILAESSTDVEAKSYIQRIQKETAYLKRIVEEFLSFAKEERLNLEEVSAPDWIQSAVELIASDAREKNVSLVVQAAPQRLSIDVTLLTSALVNLIKNAIAASSENATVEVLGETTSTGYRILVKDTGTGIPPDIQSRIFEPFFTTKAKGSGLGLPLVQKWVKAHTGTLTFESQPGHTVFSLELPPLEQF